MEKTEIIKTKTGNVQGYVKDGVKTFKGIPYAESPTGALRFKNPVKKKKWDNVLDATEYGPFAPQGYTQLYDEFFERPEQESETDCLTLNIWAPATDGVKRPVMVWIHGGSFIFGGGADLWYDGSNLAHRGDMIVVTINYRLGALGFLYIPDETVNVGLFDQIAALQWVQDNIEAFGGNPNNVTIFGESAGATSVTTLLTMPAAKGLFQRVIAQSMPEFDPRPTKRSTKELLKKLKIEAGDIDALRKISVEKIIDSQNKIIDRKTKRMSNEGMYFRPSIDGITIPIHPLEAIKKGIGKDVDLLIGTNMEEMKLFTYFMPDLKNLDKDGLQLMTSTFLSRLKIDKDKVKQLVQIYEDNRKNSTSLEIFEAILNDYAFRVPGIRMASAQSMHNSNTYEYIFTWPSPFLIGSAHAVEIPFVFGTIDLPNAESLIGKGSDVDNISERIMDAWIAFARTGNPNHDGIPKWVSYDSKKRATMFIGKEIKVEEAPFDDERAAWDDLFDY